MDVLRFVALGVVAALLCLTLRLQGRQDMALLCALAAGLVLLGWALASLTGLLGQWQTYAEAAGLDEGAVALLLKALGISLVAEFGERLCQDAGETALAGKVRLGGRVAILVLCMPLLGEVLTLMLSLLQA